MAFSNAPAGTDEFPLNDTARTSGAPGTQVADCAWSDAGAQKSAHEAMASGTA